MRQLISFCFVLNAVFSFAQNPGDVFFSEWTVHEIRFNFTQPGYFDSLKANYALDAYMRCNVQVDGVDFPVSGVKYKGNSSYNNPSKKKPFRIDFEEYTTGQELDGMSKIVLNNAFKDPTFLREKLMLDFLNAHGIAAPRATFARLYINDHYWGLYSVVEDVNKTFLKTRFDNKGGNLFKGDPRGTLVWKGYDQNLYTTDYELKTNETANDWSDLIQLINVLNNTPSQQLPDSLGKYLNLDSWYGYWAAHSMFVNLDSYIGSGHNYFVYHNTDTGKFEWISWDVNEAFGNFQMGISLANIKTLPVGFIPQPANQRPMMNKTWSQQTLQSAYLDKYCELLSDFSNVKMDARIDSLANLIRTHVYQDTLKFYSNAYFDQNLTQDIIVQGPGSSGIAGLKPFITTRHNFLVQQLAPSGCTATDATAIETPEIKISPNPASDRVIINADGQKIQLIEVYSTNGQLVLSQVADNERIVSVFLPNLPSCMYVLHVQTESAAINTKLLLGGR